MVCSTVTVLLGEQVFNVLIARKTDVNLMHHFAICTYIKLFCCAPKTNAMLFVNYSSILKRMIPFFNLCSIFRGSMLIYLS